VPWPNASASPSKGCSPADYGSHIERTTLPCTASPLRTGPLPFRALPRGDA